MIMIKNLSKKSISLILAIIGYLISGVWLVGNCKFIKKNQSLHKSRIILFSYFSKDKTCPAYVLYLIKKLKKELNADIIFIDNSGKLKENKNINSNVEAYICTRNMGRDFGAWKTGISFLEKEKILSEYDSIILTNDSIYGPFFNTNKFISKIESRNQPCVGGITDSWSPKYHLQSYFLIFNKKFINSQTFIKFWKGIFYINHKRFIINNYELGLSKKVLKCGGELIPLCNYRNVRNSFLRNSPQKNNSIYLKNALNPTHFLWKTLLVDFQCPFIKKDLLSKNPERIENLSEVEEIIKKISKYDYNLIIDDLKRVGENVSC